MTFHDPLAAVTIFDDVCRFERGNVEVELQSEKLTGMTRFSSDCSGGRQIAVEVDPERFFEHYFSVF
jgi:purine nucleosidase